MNGTITGLTPTGVDAQMDSTARPTGNFYVVRAYDNVTLGVVVLKNYTPLRSSFEWAPRPNPFNAVRPGDLLKPAP